MNNKSISFSFGENWSEFVTHISHEDIEASKNDLDKWIGKEFIRDKVVIDIGCGSGLSSLSFYLLNAKTVYSFDFDLKSVESTKHLWEKQGKPENWIIFQDSILDLNELQNYTKEKFDIVYSWGVLHHTGSIWKAINKSMSLVQPGGKYFISIYTKGPKYLKHLELKQKYNNASNFGKYKMIYTVILRQMLIRLITFRNPFTWNQKRHRGMSTYYDIIDWLGGLPYEVASEEEIILKLQKSSFLIEKIKVKEEGGCSIYVFNLPK